MRVRRLVSVILTIALAIVCITGCSSGDTDDLYNGKKVQGMSVAEYTSTIKGLVEAIYAPTSDADFQNMKSIFKKYASNNVYTKFTAVSPNYKNEKFNSTIEWKDALFADGEYQPDGQDRLWFNFDVVRNYVHYSVRLEFSVDGDGMLSNYRVY